MLENIELIPSFGSHNEVPSNLDLYSLILETQNKLNEVISALQESNKDQVKNNEYKWGSPISQQMADDGLCDVLPENKKLLKITSSGSLFNEAVKIKLQCNNLTGI